MTTNKARSRIFCLVIGLLQAGACAVSPEELLEPPAFRSSDESAAKGDADIEVVDAAQQEAPDARAGRSTRDAGSTPLRPPLDTDAPETAEDEPADEPDEAAMEPEPSAPSMPAPMPSAETPAAAEVETPVVDAGVSPADASVATTPDASLSPGTCTQATDCTQQCVPVGILRCCRSDGKCGCTWAPGAYCL